MNMVIPHGTRKLMVKVTDLPWSGGNRPKTGKEIRLNKLKYYCFEPVYYQRIIWNIKCVEDQNGNTSMAYFTK